jgi:hypothetical protein
MTGAPLVTLSVAKGLEVRTLNVWNFKKNH